MNKQNRLLSNFAGYLHDAWRLAKLRPINSLHSYSKFLALRRLKEQTGASCFIETGTFLGVTAARCARLFPKVFTIELDRSLAEQARAFLFRFPHVEVIQGDAVEHLSKLLARPDVQNVEVFLDGHYSGVGTARGSVPEPALFELDIIGRSSDKVAGVLIDDFRLFGVEPGFPSKTELMAAIERQFPHPTFDLSVHAGQVIIARRNADPNRMRDL